MQVNYTARGTGDPSLDRLISDIATAFKRIEKLAGVPLGYVPLGPDGLIDPAFIGDDVTTSTLMVSATGAANTGVTATLPAIPGKVHLITSIELVKLYSVAGVAAGAGVIVTSTNLPGNPSWTTEQLASAAGTAVPVIKASFAGNPLRASAAGVATTLVAPAQLQTIWRWNVTYLLADP